MLNAADTKAAKEKLVEIKTSFERWIWTDVERTERLGRSSMYSRREIIEADLAEHRRRLAEARAAACPATASR